MMSLFAEKQKNAKNLELPAVEIRPWTVTENIQIHLNKKQQ